MTEKKTGYCFWRETLQSPTYVAAPMVDMSELAFRILCRRHGAQLCYSPMFHSQQFLQDSLYRSDTFSTSPEDRPLIVQFCANDPATFVSAASMVTSQCDAVDLNLGCPQSIAKKGHYGAFLQDEWELISSIIKKASNELPVPVTCKMRILPGESVRSVEYAKMLEQSGCSIIAVHGRTRDQKGHTTGLASWDVIRDIKESVNIPVIANGNILSFEDVQDCLKYTRADAVMSAEGLLHNPALFSSKNPPVWDIVEEYLNLAEIYKTQFRHIRNHLFRVLYLCVRQDAKLMEDLMNGSSLEDFRHLCDSLKVLPQSCPKNDIAKQESEELNAFNDVSLENTVVMMKCAFPFLDDGLTYQNVDEPTGEVAKVSNEIYNNSSNPAFNVSYDCDKCTETHLDSCVQKLLNKNYSSKNFIEYNDQVILRRIGSPPADQNNGYISALTDGMLNGAYHPQINTDSDFYSALTEKSVKCLPLWLCHSRPRILYDSEGKGWFQRYCESAISIESKERGTSKRKLRKERHHARVLAAMKEKRKVKKLRRKQKLSEVEEKGKSLCVVPPVEKITKKEKKEMIKQRMTLAKGIAPKVCIDLGFTLHMSSKEMNWLSSQLRRLYGSNRHAEKPLHLYFCNLCTSDDLYEICCSKNDGFSSYVVDMVGTSPEEMFPLEDIIYLSPDSENVLKSLDTNKVYVIGGIVDETAYKGMSLEHAKDLKLQTARLPVTEYLERSEKCNSGSVLTVNQVFDVLLKYYETSNWIQALSFGVPQRKGFILPCEKNLSSLPSDGPPLQS